MIYIDWVTAENVLNKVLFYAKMKMNHRLRATGSQNFLFTFKVTVLMRHCLQSASFKTEMYLHMA